MSCAKLCITVITVLSSLDSSLFKWLSRQSAKNKVLAAPNSTQYETMPNIKLSNTELYFVYRLKAKKSLLKGWVTNGNSYSCGNCLRFKILMSCHGNPRLLFSNVLAPMPTERHGWTHAVSGWQMWWQMVAGSRCKKQKNHF